MLLNLSDFEGIIVILLLVFIAVGIAKKAGRFIVFCCCVLCLMQVGYMLSKTDLNDTLHLDNYFKYDILSSITKIWDDTDKEALKENIENGANGVVNETGKILEQLKGQISSSSKSEIQEEEAPPEISIEQVDEVVAIP